MVEAQKTAVDHVSDYDTSEKVNYNRAGAISAEQEEHRMGVLETVRAYPAASWWAFVMSCTIVSVPIVAETRCFTNRVQIMEAYCVFLMGNFIALPRFEQDFGESKIGPDGETQYFIAASWQSAFQAGGPVGAFIGVFLAGPITSAIGYRWATIGGLMVLNCFIFIFYYGQTLGVLFGSQVLEGIPWGIFIANAPAYCSEIVPLRLRAPATQMLQMFWAIGAIIVAGVTYHYNGIDEERAYRYGLLPTP
jgi:MFS transporter, SP family, general alpha glucoside:H+ symporter